MCDVQMDDAYATILGICANMSHDRFKDASLLLSGYLIEQREEGVCEKCVYTTMISVFFRVVLAALGDDAETRLDEMITEFAMERAR